MNCKNFFDLFFDSTGKFHKKAKKWLFERVVRRPPGPNREAGSNPRAWKLRDILGVRYFPMVKGTEIQ